VSLLCKQAGSGPNLGLKYSAHLLGRLQVAVAAEERRQLARDLELPIPKLGRRRRCRLGLCGPLRLELGLQRLGGCLGLGCLLGLLCCGPGLLLLLLSGGTLWGWWGGEGGRAQRLGLGI
jgi:hypothetical protein